MKFSLKSIAAAVALATVAVSAHAKIDSGTSPDGNGDLYFSAWNGDTSYYFDLNVRIDDYFSQKSAAGNLNLVFGSDNSDFSSSFSNWVAGSANPSAIKWTVQALDSVGARRILTTMADTVVNPTIKTADTLRTAIQGAQGFLTNANSAITASGTNAGVVNSTQANTANGAFANNVGFYTFGTLADSTYALGQRLEYITAAASSTPKGVYANEMDNGLAVKVWVDSSNALHVGNGVVAAVPEPETYAMLLAGLGLMSVVARRRNKA